MNDATVQRTRWAMGVDARGLVVVSAAIFAFGLAVLYSASAIKSVQIGNNSAYFFLRQVIGGLVGIVVFAVAAKFDAEHWRKWAWPLLGLSIVLMIVVLIPGMSSRQLLGSRRFLRGGSVQPSELAKLAVVTWTAMLVVKKGDAMRRLSKGLLPFLIVIGVLDILAWLEPDLSVAMMLTLIVTVVLFAGGVRIGHFVFLGIVAIPVLLTQVQSLDYAMRRILSFLGATGVSPQVGYQLTQSLIAVGSGGLLGQGFGQGRQQYGFLPLPEDDFIGSNIGEEWGFVGLALLVLAFAAYASFGFRIARAARSQFQQLVAVGLTLTVVLTAYLHVGVVIGLLPTTGLTLPFVSYGRSNLILTFLMTGILVNIGSTRQVVRAGIPIGPPDPGTGTA